MAEFVVGLAAKEAERLASNLLNKLYVQLSGELSLLLGVRDAIRSIRYEMEIMSAFLKMAEAAAVVNNEAMAAWVKQAKELSYAVEDCIDDFSLHLCCSGDNLFTALLCRARSIATVGTRHRIASQIHSIKAWVELVGKRISRYGIAAEISKTGSNFVYFIGDVDVVATPVYSNFVYQPNLVGLDEPRDRILHWLLDFKPQLSAMVVTGPTGLGKTSLARKVYECPAVTGRRFTCRAWIPFPHVRHNCEGRACLRDMIRQLIPSPPSDLDRIEKPQLITMLNEHLKDKKYVIVFNDIWRLDEWAELQRALPRNRHGSKVILTTQLNRKEICSRIAFPVSHVCELATLTPQQASELFCKRVFSKQTNSLSQKLEILSHDIIHLCEGFPQAIMLVASLMAERINEEYWENIIARITSESAKKPQVGLPKAVVAHCVECLPYNIKHCFLYLSKFPRGCIIKRKQIQRLWIAEGFLGDCSYVNLWELAEACFNKLLERNLIIPSVFSSAGKVTRFQVHETISEVIVSKASNDNFICVCGKKRSRTHQDHVIQRLAIYKEQSHSNELDLGHVRSLSLFGDGSPSYISPLLRMLRVLDLEDCGLLNDDHLDVVANFLHLKYLSLRNTSVSRLPKSLGNLRILQTLDFRRTRVTKIPAGIIKLQQLHFLLCSNDWNLRFPRGIGRLSSLQELTTVNLYGIDSEHIAKQLGKLTELRKLAVSGLSENSGKYFCDSLKAMTALRSLNIHSPTTVEFLNNLPSPPSLLESIKLDGPLLALPQWLVAGYNLSKLVLKGSGLRADAISLLGALPSLRHLKLARAAYIEESLCFGCDGGFRSLKVLCVERLDLRLLRFEGRMPCLELLWDVTGAHGRISERMEISGIENIPCLQELHLCGMQARDLDAVSLATCEHPNHPRAVATETTDCDLHSD